MITAKPSVTRHFIGSLDQGDNLIAGLRTFCDENLVKSAWLEGVALVEGLEVIKPTGDQGFDVAPNFLDGVWFCPAVQGSVSSSREGLDIRIYGMWQSERGEVVSGLVTSAVVKMCEFHILAADDVALRREPDSIAFGGWAGIAPGMTVSKRAGQQTKTASEPDNPVPEVAADLSEQIVAEIRQGDLIIHPGLGRCQVVGQPREGKIRIRMGNGRIATLNAEALVFSPYQTSGGKRLFPVKVRKK